MFFKKQLRLLLIVFLFALAGCEWGSNLKWGEQNPPSQGVRVNLDKYTCLSDIDKNVDQYLNGKLKEPQVKVITNCMRTAITQFMSKTEDMQNGSYLPARLAKFLNEEYFTNDKKITPEFLREIMQVKKVVLGGTETVITEEELLGVIRIVDLLEQIALKNLPFIPLYKQTYDPKKEITRSDLKAARQQLIETVKTVADLLQSRNKTYDINSLMRMIYESKKFLNWEAFHKDSYTNEQLENLIYSYKELATGNRSPIFQPKDWQNIFYSAATFYGFYLNYQIKIRNQDIRYGPSYEVLVDTVNQAFELISRWLEVAPNNTILFDVTDRVFASLEAANLLPLKTTKKSISRVYYQLMTKGLRPLSDNKKISNGFTDVQLKEMKSEFNIWSVTQSELNNNIQRSLKLKFSDLEKITGEMNMRVNQLDLTSVFSIAPFQVDFGMREISNIISTLRPMFRISDRRAYVMPVEELPASGVFNNIQQMSYMNTMRMIMRLLIRSFATDANVVNMAGVTEGDLNAYAEVIGPLGVELNFMDARKTDPGSNYYTEGNLFTFSGDGIARTKNHENSLLTFNEGLEFMSLLWSSGNIRDGIYNSVLVRCGQSNVSGDVNDLFNLKKIERKCFEQNLYNNQLIEISNLPHMLRYIRSLRPNERQAFFKDLQDIALIACEDHRYIENSEIATMSTVLHYAEVIFTVYDNDKNGLLDPHELMRAFKRFYGYFDRVIFQTKNKRYDISTIKAVFVYILKYKEIPDGLVDGSTLAWYSWNYNFNNNVDQVYEKVPDVSLDRSGLVRVLSLLAAVSRAPHEQKCAEEADWLQMFNIFPY